MKKHWLLLLVAVLFAFSVLGCGEEAADPGGDDEGDFEGEVLIGIMVPTTGSVADNGIDMENAIKLAVSEINAAGGVLGHKIVTTTGDDGCDPSMATAAASKLVSEEVVAVVGGYCSGATLPTLKIYGDAQIPFVISTANATTLIDENPGWAFMINSTGDLQAENAVAWFEHLGVDTIVLVDDGTAFSTDLRTHTKQQWEANGHQVVSEETIVPGEQDFSAIVTSIVAANPDGVYWTAYHAEGAQLIMQLRQGGYEGEIIVADGSSSPELLSLAGEFSNGIYCTSPPVADFLPDGQNFIQNYKAMFPREPGAYASLAYDATYLLVDAIERAGSFDGTAIKDALAATEQFEGLAGLVIFTPENTLARSNFIITVGKDGKWALPE